MVVKRSKRWSDVIKVWNTWFRNQYVTIKWFMPDQSDYNNLFVALIRPVQRRGRGFPQSPFHNLTPCYTISVILSIAAGDRLIKISGCAGPFMVLSEAAVGYNLLKTGSFA